MADSFGAATFNVLREPLRKIRPSRVNLHYIPGGNNFYVDLAGRGEDRLSLKLHVVGNSALSMLENLVNTRATLTYYRGAFSAILSQLSYDDPLWDAASGEFVYEVDAEFILL